jgi:hypothetical protein
MPISGHAPPDLRSLRGLVSDRGGEIAARPCCPPWRGSNEGPGVLPGIAVPERHRDNFALVRDGTAAIACTDPHGTWIEWLA